MFVAGSIGDGVVGTDEWDTKKEKSKIKNHNSLSMNYISAWYSVIFIDFFAMCRTIIWVNSISAWYLIENFNCIGWRLTILYFGILIRSKIVWFIIFGIIKSWSQRAVQRCKAFYLSSEWFKIVIPSKQKLAIWFKVKQETLAILQTLPM